ncbi:hypothetical protein EMIHUDRAFT_368426, partial [Emiliania huxleyi CCMP1516]|uniref:Uncharacterized protein n=2 Tax=Emiliania huxleyi TaxID=2903 RepID=A0A0D3JFS4_EMIH1
MWASGPAAARRGPRLWVEHMSLRPGSARPATAGRGRARSRCSSRWRRWRFCGDKSSVVQRSGACRLSLWGEAGSLSSFVADFAHARAARPASLREGMSLPRFDPAAKSCSLESRPTLPPRLQLLSSPEDWCLICCLPADAAGEPGGPLTIGSFSHQSEITREQLSLPLASPPSPSGIRGILWVVQRVISGHLMTTMKPPRPRRTHGAGSLGYRDRPQLRLRANKLPSPNH